MYRDLVRNVVFLGAPSTGKTTLCQRLASRYRTQWMPEYGPAGTIGHSLARFCLLAVLFSITDARMVGGQYFVAGTG